MAVCPLTDSVCADFLRPLQWLGIRNRRSDVLSLVEPPVLEEEVGTGTSLASYDGMKPAAIDLNYTLMHKARRRAITPDSQATLTQMDVLRLTLPDSTFACAATSLVFCTVTDPVHVLPQLPRLLHPHGKI